MVGSLSAVSSPVSQPASVYKHRAHTRACGTRTDWTVAVLVATGEGKVACDVLHEIAHTVLVRTRRVVCSSGGSRAHTCLARYIGV